MRKLRQQAEAENKAGTLRENVGSCNLSIFLLTSSQETLLVLRSDLKGPGR